MKILGIESSCDETAAAVVEDGRTIISNVIATQIPFHAMYNGVVPEIASRKHTEWILPVVRQALAEANLTIDGIDGIAVTNRPGLMGSLLVGLTFAKTLAWAAGKPFIAVNHMLGHMYASHLAADIPYPYLGLLVSGGHSIICVVRDFDDVEILGTTIDDAVGEAFDKVAKFYGFGYPGGVAIDKLAKNGNPKAAHFPMPMIDKQHRDGAAADGSADGAPGKAGISGAGPRAVDLEANVAAHRYDVSYSGLKTAAINQIDRFWNPDFERTSENIAASFQEAAVKILLSRLFRAVEDTGLTTVVAGGGVAANSRLRALLAEQTDLTCVFPPLKLCTDNAAMIAGLGYKYLSRGETSEWSVNASARVQGFRKYGRPHE